jgi:hypothetical protein
VIDTEQDGRENDDQQDHALDCHGKPPPRCRAMTCLPEMIRKRLESEPMENEAN